MKEEWRGLAIGTNCTEVGNAVAERYEMNRAGIIRRKFSGHGKPFVVPIKTNKWTWIVRLRLPDGSHVTSEFRNAYVATWGTAPQNNPLKVRRLTNEANEKRLKGIDPSKGKLWRPVVVKDVPEDVAEALAERYKISAEGIVMNTQVSAGSPRFIGPKADKNGGCIYRLIVGGKAYKVSAFMAYMDTWGEVAKAHWRGEKWVSSTQDEVKRMRKENEKFMLRRSYLRQRESLKKARKEEQAAKAAKEAEERRQERRWRDHEIRLKARMERAAKNIKCPWENNTLDIYSTARGADPVLGF